jgi:hypothetical protein
MHTSASRGAPHIGRDALHPKKPARVGLTFGRRLDSVHSDAGLRGECVTDKNHCTAGQGTQE